MRNDENRKALKMALDEAENRCTKLELGRRSLDGDLQRFKLVMNDKETENQVRGRFSVCVWGGSSFYVSERWIHIYFEGENPIVWDGSILCEGVDPAFSWEVDISSIWCVDIRFFPLLVVGVLLII